MLFDLPTTTSLVNQAVTLKPGNMVFTGTPGASEQLHHGDVSRRRRRNSASRGDR